MRFIFSDRLTATFLCLISVLIPVFIFGNVSLAGFGVSPPDIIENRLVPGSSFERRIMLVQGEPNRDLPASVSVESADIKDWISFPDGDSFIIPTGVQQYPLTVRVDVPEDADFGIYKGVVRIQTTPERATEDGEVAIALGGRVDIEIEVGDDIISEYEISDIDILDIKEGERPVVKIRIRNLGNVPTSPDSATFELFNKFGDIRLAFSQVEGFEKVPAFSEGEIFVEFPMDIYIAIGEYWGHAKIYDDEGVVRRELRTPFNVSEKTFLEKFALWFWIIGGIIVLFLLIFTTYVLLRRFRNKKFREAGDSESVEGLN